MKRRGHNEGSLYKREDDRWAGVISVEGKRRFVYGKTRQEAQRKMNAALRDLQAGLPITPERQNVEQFLRSSLDLIKPMIEEAPGYGIACTANCTSIRGLAGSNSMALTPQKVQGLHSNR